MENLGRCRLLFENVRPSDRAARCRVVGVAGKDMCVEVGNPVPEGEQVHLHRMKLRFDGACYSENVRPIFARRFRVEFSRLRHVAIPPDNDAVARKPAPSVQANLARRESGNEHRVVTLVSLPSPAQRGQSTPALRSSQSSGHPEVTIETHLHTHLRRPYGRSQGAHGEKRRLRRSRSLCLRQSHQDDQGFMSSTPTSAKSFSFLVASRAPLVRQIAAICASYPLIGAP